ncbi:MAG: oxygen-independent coproporphyrinogen III oxidase [Rhodospirillales bacterium]|nr:MAG: oxygen-independent coproporphyrinogen III oxidase [Rhodospirillales bacterium]
MDSTILQRYDRRVPRYTSYPTAPHFHSGIGADTYSRWLAAIGDQSPLSLYFHVPFCHEMCWYCGCHTKIVRRYEPIGGYAATLADEVKLIGSAITARPPVTHMHWGGGTPTILSVEDFTRIMNTIRGSFLVAPDAEIAVEMDPRTVTQEMIAGLAKAGMTRASLGVQDFTERVQTAINRIQPYEMTARVVGWLRDAGISGVNFDLMYGLPHQTVEDVRRSADLTAELKADRVAVFGYAHVPWMKTHQRMIPEDALPDGTERFEQAEAAAMRLVENGYRRIGLDHFALPGDAMVEALDAGQLHRNFQGYTTDQAQALIGFGASSIGALPQGYVQNAVPLRAWADAVRHGRPAVDKGIALSDEDRLRRAVIERLMCDLRVDLSAECRRYNESARHFAAELQSLQPMAEDGLVIIDDDRIEITEVGQPLMRTVCAVFDTYLASGAGRHSRAV